MHSRAHACTDPPTRLKMLDQCLKLIEERIVDLSDIQKQFSEEHKDGESS